MSKNKSYFFCGIGGSGMLPLANIVRDSGATVAGSDRALDQGRLGAKFEWLQSMGIGLHKQDGSGLTSGDQILIASAAIEDSVPDIAKGIELGCPRMTRAELLAELFNAAPRSIAVGGTSGKSTVTGMIGWILTDAGLDPTIMNGGVMKNFVADNAPFASARVGQIKGDGGDVFVSEVDESDGSIALFTPEVAVLNNVSLDHKSLEELRLLFGDFARDAKTAIWNADDIESVALMAALPTPLPLAGGAGGGPEGEAGKEYAARDNETSPTPNPSRKREGDIAPRRISFGFTDRADIRALDVIDLPLGSRFTLHANGEAWPVTLQVPGRHNIANALAAIAAAIAVGVHVPQAIHAMERFTGLARRFDIVGIAGGITVIDDFGHNPDKTAATLATLKAFPGRVIAFFQPHGYGPIRVMGQELAAVFAAKLGRDDHLILCDPVYFGGTVDRSLGSQSITDAVLAAGRKAEHIPSREACGDRIVELAQAGDRIVIMGARDDTLSAFAADVLVRLVKASV